MMRKIKFVFPTYSEVYRKVAIRNKSYIFDKFSRTGQVQNNFDCTVITTFKFRINT